MADSRKSRLTRRTFLKGAGVATAAAVGPTIIVRSARAKSDTLKIGQWTHFVPAFDEWFDKKYCPEWGAKNNVKVVVDHISVNDLRARVVGAGRRLPVVHDPLLRVAPHGVLQVDPQGHRGGGDGRRLQPGASDRADRHADLAGRDPVGGHLRLHADDPGVYVRADLHHLERSADGERGGADEPGARGRLLLGLADGRLPDHQHPRGLPLQPLPQPVHLRLHARRDQVAPSSRRTSAAPATSARSLAWATSRASGTIPQLVQG